MESKISPRKHWAHKPWHAESQRWREGGKRGPISAVTQTEACARGEQDRPWERTNIVCVSNSNYSQRTDMTRKNVDVCLAVCKTAGTVPSLVCVCTVCEEDWPLWLWLLFKASLWAAGFPVTNKWELHLLDFYFLHESTVYTNTHTDRGEMLVS